MIFIYVLLIFLNLLPSCHSYRMFLSICNAVFTTLISEFIDNTKYISVKSNLNFSNTKKVSLLIFKGNNIQPSNYIGISKKIQKL